MRKHIVAINPKKLLNNEMTRIVSTLTLIKCRERKKETEREEKKIAVYINWDY